MAGGKSEAGIGQPIGLADVSPIADEDVVEDDIEAPTGPLEVDPRVASHDIDAEPIEVEPAARRANDPGVDLDTRDPRLGRECTRDNATLASDTTPRTDCAKSTTPRS
jgi:hypothetical protein